MIYCDKCKHEFNPKIRTRYIQDDVEEIFFNCPSCHERYTAYYLNDKVKGLQSRARITRGNKALNNMIQNRIKKEMNRLEKLYDTQ